MSTKVGLISDVHASPAPVAEALEIFRENQVATILCAGDVAGYGENLEKTVELLIKSGCTTVMGNHDFWYLENNKHEDRGAAGFLRNLPRAIHTEIEETRVSMVHASPTGELLDGIRLLDEDGEPVLALGYYWANKLQKEHTDILIVGHTHQVFAEQLGDLLVINPGSTLFNHTCAILSLPDRNVEFFPLSGKEPVLCWNFSMLRR